PCGARAPRVRRMPRGASATPELLSDHEEHTPESRCPRGATGENRMKIALVADRHESWRASGWGWPRPSSGGQAVHQARERHRLAHVVQPADPLDGALEPEPEARVRHAPVAAQVEVPLERLLRELVLFDRRLERREIVLALAAADD